jgi:hypothetical protein
VAVFITFWIVLVCLGFNEGLSFAQLTWLFLFCWPPLSISRIASLDLIAVMLNTLNKTLACTRLSSSRAYSSAPQCNFQS